MTSYGRNKNLDDELKKNRTTPDVKLKEISLINQKLDLERDMSDLVKALKKSDRKILKLKINVKMPHVNKQSKKLKKKQIKIKVKLLHVKKSLAKRQFFVQAPFSQSTFKLERKNQAAKPLAFSLHFLFRRDQNQYSNLTYKIIKMCEQILKKDSAPIQFKFFELQKTKRRPIIASSIASRLLKRQRPNAIKIL